MDWQGAIIHTWNQDWVRNRLIPGLGAVAIAVLGWWREHRRRHRSDPDAVPWLPWRDISFWATFAALFLLMVAFWEWLNE